MDTRFLALACGALALAGCGGDDSAPATKSGQFKDSNTAGLVYESGGITGVTDANGTFTYQAGSPVTFKVGGITLGTATGKAVITPLDLVPAGASNPATVQTNIVRFLMMLDSDGDAGNGISLSPALQLVADSWTASLDFSMADIAASTDVAAIISAAVAADGGTHVLPPAGAAAAHLQSTLRCAYAGAFKGTYSGTPDHGNFGLMVDAVTGEVSGIAYSIPDAEWIGLTGTSPLDFNNNASFLSGDTTGNATFSGAFTSMDSLTGQWAVPSGGGTFSGTRVGGALDAVYRYTGSFTGDSGGLFALDITAAGAVTGIAYSPGDGKTYPMSGTLTSNVLALRTTDNEVSISGTIDLVAGTMQGNWTNVIDSSAGSFTGAGCKLN